MVKEEAPSEVPSTEKHKVFLTGLPYEATTSSLSTFFSTYGKVIEAVFKTGSDGTVVKGQAFIHFESHETVDKLLEEKFIMMENRKVVVKKAFDYGDQEGDENRLDIPPEALRCIVCKKDKFFSVESYLNHRKGKQHNAVFKIFSAKRASVRNLLKAEAKLAADRQYDKEWMKAKPNFSHRCEICQCQIFCKPQKHNSSVEHKMVKNYDVLKCCDIVFNNERKKYEYHLLSLTHLQNTYEKDLKNRAAGDKARLTMKGAIDTFKQCDADLKEMRETYGELDINTELPPYDPTKPIGLNYVVKKINYYCICCDQKFFPNIGLVDPHCRSYSHFTNMQDYILDIERKQSQKKRTEVAAQKRAAESAEKRKCDDEDQPASKKRAVITTKDPKGKKVVKTDKSEEEKTVKSEKVISDEDVEKVDKVEDATVEGDMFAKEDAEVVEQGNLEEEEEHVTDEEEDAYQNEEEEEETYTQGREEDEYQQEEEEEENIEGEEEEFNQEGEYVLDDEESENEEQETYEEQEEESREAGDDQGEEAEALPEDDQVEEIMEVEMKRKQVEVVDIEESEPVEVTPKEEEPLEEIPEETVKPKAQTATRGRRGRGRARSVRLRR